jgi:hypothetical protein
MPRTIADYVVIWTDSFKVANASVSSQEWKHDFTVPGGARLQDRCVLYFLARIKDPENLHINIYVNGKPVMEWAAAGDLMIYGTLHAVIKGGVLESGNNTIRFVSSGDPADSATFSDVVLMFQRLD